MNNPSIETISTPELLKELEERHKQQKKEIEQLNRVTSNAYITIRKIGEESKGFRLEENEKIKLNIGPGIEIEFVRVEHTIEENNK